MSFFFSKHYKRSPFGVDSYFIVVCVLVIDPNKIIPYIYSTRLLLSMR